MLTGDPQEPRDVIASATELADFDDAIIYRPGDVCPASGQYALYVALDERAQPEREVTMIAGHRFPPTPHAGVFYRLADLTQHMSAR